MVITTIPTTIPCPFYGEIVYNTGFGCVIDEASFSNIFMTKDAKLILTTDIFETKKISSMRCLYMSYSI